MNFGFLQALSSKASAKYFNFPFLEFRVLTFYEDFASSSSYCNDELHTAEEHAVPKDLLTMTLTISLGKGISSVTSNCYIYGIAKLFFPYEVIV